jgi:hypothetical protein
MDGKNKRYKYIALFVTILVLANIVINAILKDYVDLVTFGVGLAILGGITYHEFTDKFAKAF